MRIVNLPPIAPQAAPREAQRPEGGRAVFELPQAKAAESAAKREGVSGARAPGVAVAGLETLMAVQGAQGRDPEAERREKRRRALRHGAKALDLLDDMKVALLSGGGDAATLLRLRAMAGLPPEPSGEAGLDDVIAEIDLRVQVELAKREAAARR